MAQSNVAVGEAVVADSVLEVREPARLRRLKVCHNVVVELEVEAQPGSLA
jgi:hypothetical protein